MSLLDPFIEDFFKELAKEVDKLEQPEIETGQLTE